MMRRWYSRELIVAVLASILVDGTARAQSAAGSPVTAGAERSGVGVSFDERPSLTMGPLTVSGLARFQFDQQQFAEAESEWVVHRARVGIEGHLFRLVEYQLERELNDDTNPWRDAYVDVSPVDALQARAGHFKIPFSLDELTSSTQLDFAYRSLAGSSLAPGRDVGVSIHGRLLARHLHYETGWFRRGGENVRASERSVPSSRRTLAIRLTYTPWRNARRSSWGELTVGGGGTAGELPEGLNSVNGRTVSDESFFPRVYVNGRRERIGADLEWRRGSVGVRTEAIRVFDERRGESTDDGDLPRVRADGGYVSATWIVTGERKTDRVRPQRPLLHGIGAIELAGRVERLAFGSVAAGEPSGGPRAAITPRVRTDVLTLGINWYLNRFVRLQLNGIRERRFENDVELREAPSWHRVFRIQFAL